MVGFRGIRLRDSGKLRVFVPFNGSIKKAAPVPDAAGLRHGGSLCYRLSAFKSSSWA